MNKNEIKEILFEETNGRCAYCGCELPDRWHIDHINPVLRNSGFDNKKNYNNPENHKIQNMIASCPKCNYWKRDMSVEQFREYIKECSNYCDDMYPRYRVGKKFGVITEFTDLSITFYAEKIGLLK